MIDLLTILFCSHFDLYSVHNRIYKKYCYFYDLFISISFFIFAL